MTENKRQFGILPYECEQERAGSEIHITTDPAEIEILKASMDSNPTYPAGFYDNDRTAERSMVQGSYELEQEDNLLSRFASGLFKINLRMAGKSKLYDILNESYKRKIHTPSNIELLEEIATNPTGFIYFGEIETIDREYTILSLFYYSLDKNEKFRAIEIDAVIKAGVLESIEPIHQGNYEYLKECLTFKD